MKRLFFLFLAALFLAAAWIGTSTNQPTPKKDLPVLRDPFRPDHPTRQERDAERASAAAAAGATKKER